MAELFCAVIAIRQLVRKLRTTRYIGLFFSEAHAFTVKFRARENTLIVTFVEIVNIELVTAWLQHYWKDKVKDSNKSTVDLCESFGLHNFATWTAPALWTALLHLEYGLVVVVIAVVTVCLSCFGLSLDCGQMLSASGGLCPRRALYLVASYCLLSLLCKLHEICHKSIRGDWKCGSGKIGRRSQGWKMQEPYGKPNR